MDARPLYQFGSCTIDRRLRQVRVNGIIADAQPKAFDLLLYLIQHHDRVVDKDELLAQLWPGVVVSESALTQALRKARALVGDDGTRQAVIRTVQRRGFRFVAELADAESAGNGSRTAERTVEHAVAVLPFTDMSPSQDQEYFCDGLTEEIITELTRTPGLRVAARTSVFVFKNRPEDVRKIARRLGVTTILEGSARKSGDRLRVTAQLIDARTGFHLWSERWDRGLEDMLAVQDEIATRVAAALRPSTPTPDTPPGTANEFCRRGFTHVHRVSQHSQRFAQELFRQALALDSRNTRAWAGLAISHYLLYRYAVGSDAHKKEALEAARRAFEVDADSADAWVARGIAATLERDSAAATAAFERAIAIAPEHFEAHYYYGHTCTQMGRFMKAVQLYERAAQLRSEDYQALLFAAQAYRALGLDDDARAAEQRLLVAGERAVRTDPTDARALSLTACALMSAGRTEEAREWLRRSSALEPDEPYIKYNMACALVRLGEPETALDVLEQIDFSVLARGCIEYDTDLDPLRQHPRFEALITRVRC